MAQPIISVENLGKSYLIGHQSSSTGGYTALRDVVGRTVKDAGRKAWDMVRGRQIIQGDEVEEFWALRDVSFEVQPGEVLGIIGRNGAGKSTLLKILSRITEPTEGCVTLRGRVASLLEVGTGFHPELTGRENIFLNGAILGMTRAEIKRKFDEIVDFAGVEKFLDTPVKRYSSGMYVRLAFAVAAHLEPEILVVDEVLAVGDAEFQKRCTGKMKDVALGGRTVLFVSHNVGLISELCDRCMRLQHGSVVDVGKPSKVVAAYLAASIEGDSPGVADLRNHPNRLQGMKRALIATCLRNSEGNTTSSFLQSEKIAIDVEYDASAQEEPISGVGFILESVSGVRVGGFNSYMASMPPHRVNRKGCYRFEIPAPTLTPGAYLLSVSLGIHQSRLLDKVVDAVRFDIEPKDIYGTGYLLTPEDGVVALSCTGENVKWQEA